MPSGSHNSLGRIVTLIVLGVLVVTISAAAYLVFSRLGPTSFTVAEGEEGLQMAQARRLLALLVMLLVSALLILLFVIGAYFLIRVGRVVAREEPRRPPTDYTDAWGQYRLTDEQIAAATGEDESDDLPEDIDDDNGSSDDFPHER